MCNQTHKRIQINTHTHAHTHTHSFLFIFQDSTIVWSWNLYHKYPLINDNNCESYLFCHMAGVYFTEHTLVFQQNWIMTSPFKKTHWWMFQLHVTSTTLDTEVINLTHIFWLILSDFQNEPFTHAKKTTAWKVSKYGVFSAPYFPAFGTNTERYSVSLRIHSKCGEIPTRQNSVFGHFSRSGHY